MSAPLQRILDTTRFAMNLVAQGTKEVTTALQGLQLVPPIFSDPKFIEAMKAKAGQISGPMSNDKEVKFVSASRGGEDLYGSGQPVKRINTQDLLDLMVAATKLQLVLMKIRISQLQAE